MKKRRDVNKSIQNSRTNKPVKRHNINTTSNPKLASKYGVTYIKPVVTIGRNEPCYCGSGVKYKKCHLETQIIVNK